MFKIFITARALAETCMNEGEKERKDQSKWFRVLARQRKIYTIYKRTAQLNQINCL